MEDEKALTEEIVALASQFGRYGYRKITALLRHRGWHVNHKRVERIWRREGLRVPAKQSKRGRLWLNDDTGLWVLTVIDEYSRACLAILAALSIRSAVVIEVPTELMVFRGVPDHIRSGNGPEFTARAVREWLGRVGARTLYIEPGSPWENGYIESFNGKLRDRPAGQGGILFVGGGACADGAVQTALQPDQTAQLSGLPAAGA